MKTVLHPRHLELGARMVPFGGWDMPVQYSGILAEVKAVRTAAGLFDVSHMGRFYISGSRAAEFLDWMLTTSASGMRPGRARYCLICNEEGGVIDDTIFYRLADDEYLLIPNAGNRQRVAEWFQRWIDERFSDGCVVDDRTDSTALIACQGPEAAALVERLADAPLADLRSYAWRNVKVLNIPVMAARTGYTGEDGLELVANSGDAIAIWDALLDLGVLPCGLGARDVLRLEAGLSLHGHETDEQTTPIEAALERFVNFDKEHVGADILSSQARDGVAKRLVGFKTPGRSAPRAGYSVLVDGEAVGVVTSGSYSPTLDTSIAMGYVLERYAQPGLMVELDIRGRSAPAEIVQPPFYVRQRKSRSNP